MNKTYKLEVIKKKKPLRVERKKIREMVRKKQIPVSPFQPKTLPRVETQTKIMRMAKVPKATPPMPASRKIPLQNVSAVSRSKSVQTASVSSFKLSNSAVLIPRKLSSKVTSSLIGRVVPNQKQVERVWAGASAPRHFSNVFPKNDEEALRVTFLAEGATRFSMASFQPRPVPSIMNRGSLRGYTRGIQQKIAARKKYPKKARRNGMEGQVTVRFTILKSGDVKNLMVISKAPYSILNKAALEAIKRAAPFPDFPEEIPQDFLELELPFKFELKR